MKKEPAFPNIGSNVFGDFPGLTIRDYFAAKAMQGLYSGIGGKIALNSEKLKGDVKVFYMIADAMLEEGSKK